MTVAVVVPCYNEAARFDVEAFVELAGRVDTLMLVDDGSTDATGELLTAVEDRSGGRAEVHRLARNQGKAEAVRSGMSAAIDSGSDIIAYFDADLATPVDELLRLIDLLREHEELSVVLASRIRLLGHAIERRTSRHYLGRLYATAASLTLRLPVYDSQCGAKAFRSTPALRRAVEVPFPDAWSFDVELLARLLHPAAGVEPVDPDEVLEVPLRAWSDVAGSKLGTVASARALVALAGVHRRMNERSRPAAATRCSPDVTVEG
jgi:dolichyl-phosphate beta-glucosyltransferase